MSLSPRLIAPEKRGTGSVRRIVNDQGHFGLGQSTVAAVLRRQVYGFGIQAAEHSVAISQGNQFSNARRHQAETPRSLGASQDLLDT